MTHVFGLGLVVAAVIQSSAIAQPPPPRPDSARARADSIARADSLADTLQSPLARAEAPGIEPAYYWSRDALFATGAHSLAELLVTIPGVTPFRSGYIASPAAVAYLGDPGRVRVFYDGLEFDPLDPRTGDILDLVEIPLWTVEEVRVERGADELRVHLRSWRVRTTTPVTRTDIYTGDEDTNLYRGFFGRRFRNGLALQLAGEQYSTQSRRTTDAGDALSVVMRFGWSSGPWSLDGMGIRTARNRSTQDPTDPTSGGRPIPPLDARRTDAYIRAAYGDPDEGLWAQTIAASQSFEEHTPGTGSTPSVPGGPIPDPDSSRSMAQYLFTGGLTRGPFRLSVTDRLEVREGERINGQAARLGFERGWSAVSLFGERAPADSTTRAGVVARLGVTDFLWIGGAASQRWDDEERFGAHDVFAYRGELGIRLGALQLSGGVLARDSVTIRPLRIIDTSFAARDDTSAFGQFATIRGQLWRDLFIDATGTHWNAEGPYRPEWQSRVHLYLSTRWLRQFPSGNFGFTAGVTHEYRSDVCFARSDGGCDTAGQHRVLSTRVELRIVNAVLTFQLDNLQLALFERVPGFQMARGVSYYGVRWEFYN